MGAIPRKGSEDGKGRRDRGDGGVARRTKAAKKDGDGGGTTKGTKKTKHGTGEAGKAEGLCGGEGREEVAS